MEAIATSVPFRVGPTSVPRSDRSVPRYLSPAGETFYKNVLTGEACFPVPAVSKGDNSAKTCPEKEKIITDLRWGDTEKIWFPTGNIWEYNWLFLSSNLKEL